MEKLNIIITKNGMLINLEQLKIAGIHNDIKEKLTITTKKVIGRKSYTKEMLLYKYYIFNNIKYFAISRFSGIKTIIKNLAPKINISYGNKINEGKSLSFSTTIDLEEHQQICLDYMLSNIYNSSRIKAGSASCIFVMDTGLGKTFTSAALIEKFKTKTLIVIPNKSNLDGWYDPFKIYLKDVILGEYHSDKKIDGDVVIMTIDSALSQNFTFSIPSDINKKEKITIPYNEYFNQFGFIIYDEIHNYPTKSYQEIFWRTNFKYSIGLTATPNERSDEMDIIYYKHVGNIVNANKIPGFLDYAKELKWKGVVNVIEYYSPSEFSEQYYNSMGWTDTTEMQKQFARDTYRNKMIIDIIKEKFSNNRNVFIFAIHRSFLDNIYDAMVKENLPVDKTIKFMGGSTIDDKIKAKEQAQIILTTYSFGKESVSIKRMDTIIFAQPMRNKMRQTIGRILRRGGDASIEREIIDIRDMNTTLKSQFSTRKSIYKEKGFPINYKTIKIE